MKGMLTVKGRRTAKKALRPLVFDLDGTLIDSRGDIAAACNHALGSIGREPLPVQAIANHVGSGARALLQGVLGEAVGDVDVDVLFQEFQSYYVEYPTVHNAFMKGAEQCLELRTERKIALCTNKPAHLTRAVLSSLGWLDRFDFIAAPLPGDRVKPAPDLLQKVAVELGVAGQDLVMIGDSPQDIAAGKAIGAYTVGVKGGFLPLERLVFAKPDLLLENLEELSDHLENL